MAEGHRKEWLAFQAERKHSHETEEWIPIYQEKGSSEPHKLDEYEEAVHLRSFAVFNDKLDEYERRVTNDIRMECSILNSVKWIGPEFDEALRYKGRPFSSPSGIRHDISAIIPGLVSEDKNNIGFHIVCIFSDTDGYSASLKFSYFINPDFMLAFGIYPDKAPPVILKDFYGKPVIRNTQNTEKGSLIEVKKSYLQSYLMARNAKLRLVYNYDRCAFLKQTLNEDTSEKSDKYNFYYSIGHYSMSVRNVAAGIVEVGKMWKGEWVSASVPLSVNMENERVQINGKYGHKAVSLKQIEEEHTNYCLSFEPDIIENALKEGGTIEWWNENEGFLNMPGCRLFFGVDTFGKVRLMSADFIKGGLPPRLMREWILKNICPNPAYDPNRIVSFYYWRHTRKAPPEVYLLQAFDNLAKVFRKKFGEKALFREDSKNASRRLSRFYCLESNGIKGLAIEIKNYTIERIIHSEAFIIAKKELKLNKRANLSEFFTKIGCSSQSKILSALNELRGDVVHAETYSQTLNEAHKILGIDVDEHPLIIQGFQLLNIMAKALDEIAHSLENFSLKS